ncbi:cell wall proline rich protein [Cordyceps fumosorosea ARSEF 2679]|uniref:Cell wall proline rich protein n=1 Tax=Cordyceps fumosorosea (strain ARSEF 2679) TaxID=1081104 RepID=A0A168EM69_CORFA|nr:cell wall proline rich protein [Cordyceps fumosorosea ARSEF 2679]OAA73978.1 cell wall proline rich protein [Cordyceps fumosorosea ARSEF 2679]
MAATFGSVTGRDESSPTLQPLTYDARQNSRSPASSRRDAPLAIPDFVFPTQSATPDFAPDFESPMQASAFANNQEFSFPSRDNLPHRPAALPDFSFNPGASIPHCLHSPALLSPPTSPHSPNPTPSSRPVRHGHRRGGSEFVGGSIRDGNSIAVMSTSPTKEAGFPQSLQPPPRRRGHKRGLSGAISTNDLPILQPPTMDWTPKGSSAPNSPTNFDQGINATIPLADDSTILTALPEPVHQPPSPAAPAPEPDVSIPPSPRPARTTNRARVGFSDTLEFIPRPLSLVSSDTSSTVTARPGHCMSESISSVVSPASTSDDHSPSALSRSPTREMPESRPSTAGAILETVAGTEPEQTNTSPRRRNSIPALIGATEPSIADSALPSPARASKRWSFFGLETFGPSSMSSRTRPISSSSSDSVSRTHTVSSSDRESDSDAANPSKSKHKKKSKKSRTRTVRGWAGAILPIKGKGEKRKCKPSAVRPPTPPPSVTPLDEDEDDEDDCAGQETFPALSAHIQPPQLPTLVTQQPRRPDEVMSPMIDLDAALGPFNTPLPHNPEWEAAQRAAGGAGRRRLHSAQGMKGFGGPGMHYHRRAESAPDLPPFDAGRAGINRFSSNSTMADVFEEEEEEDDGGSSDGGNTTATPGVDVPLESKITNVFFSDSGSETTSLRGLAMRRKSSGLSDKDQSGARSPLLDEHCVLTSVPEVTHV